MCAGTGKIESLSELREQRQQFDRLQDVYVRLSEGKTQLEVIEKRSQDYEEKKRTPSHPGDAFLLSGSSDAGK